MVSCQSYGYFFQGIAYIDMRMQKECRNVLR
jgi:hypothetical protein